MSSTLRRRRNTLRAGRSADATIRDLALLHPPIHTSAAGLPTGSPGFLWRSAPSVDQQGMTSRPARPNRIQAVIPQPGSRPSGAWPERESERKLRYISLAALKFLRELADIIGIWNPYRHPFLPSAEAIECRLLFPWRSQGLISTDSDSPRKPRRRR